MFFFDEEENFVVNLSGMGEEDKCKERLDASALSDNFFSYLGGGGDLFSSRRLSGGREF